MASGVQDITCVFVEVAGSYEKKLQSYSVLGWCVVHQWCQNVLVRLTGGWNYLHYITLGHAKLIICFCPSHLAKNDQATRLFFLFFILLYKTFPSKYGILVGDW